MILAAKDMLFESEGMLLILGGFTLFIVEGKLLLVDGNVEVLLVLLLNICCCCCCIPGNVESFVDRSMVVFSNADLELFIIMEFVLFIIIGLFIIIELFIIEFMLLFFIIIELLLPGN